MAQSLATDEQIDLVPGGTDDRYVPTGHIVYGRDGTLVAVPFDLDAMRATSGPVSMVQEVRPANGRTGAINYAVTTDGALVYVRGGSFALGDAKVLAWVPS